MHDAAWCIAMIIKMPISIHAQITCILLKDTIILHKDFKSILSVECDWCTFYLGNHTTNFGKCL